MLSINTNISSLIAQNSLTTSTNKLNQAIERMTTGFKINHAKDNAANYSIATNLTTKIGAYMVAEDNCAMGLDMLATANGSLDQISDKLSRLRILAEQASNGTYGEQSLKAINAEANALVDEVERIYNNTEYNGINLMKGRVTGSEESKFIKDIDRRDTSKMTKLSSIDPTEKLEIGTYSISTAEELAQLAEMTRNELIGTDTEFVLGADIDLQAWCDAHAATGGWVPIGIAAGNTSLVTDGKDKAFKGNFDGNGYVISNFTINRTTENYQALFGVVYGNSEIKNLALENFNISGNSGAAPLIGYSADTVIVNCYINGGILTSNSSSSGGMIGQSADGIIKSSWVNVEHANFASGLVGDHDRGTLLIEDSCVLSESSNISRVVAWSTANLILNNFSYNSYFDDNSVVLSNTTPTTENLTTVDSINDLNKGDIFTTNTSLSLQVGTNSEVSSQILVDTGYVIDGINSLRGIGLNDVDYLSYIDKFMSNLSGKMTTLGASENRLESALDEISTQYENLVSTRSTIRDADIAEVSSEYIRQQILQQASATLLATANQSPSIALQLI